MASNRTIIRLRVTTAASAPAPAPALAPPPTISSAGPKKGQPPKPSLSAPKTEAKPEALPPAPKKCKAAAEPISTPKKKKTVTMAAPPTKGTRRSGRVRHPTTKSLLSTTSSSANAKPTEFLPTPPSFPSHSSWKSTWTEPALATITFSRPSYVPDGEETLKRHQKEVVELRKELRELNGEMDRQMGDGVVTRDRVPEEKMMRLFAVGLEGMEAIKDAEAWGNRKLDVLRVLDRLVGRDEVEKGGEEEEYEESNERGV